MMITLTDRAKTKVKQLLEAKRNPTNFVRLGVKGGGCSGLMYTVDLDNHMDPKDKAFGEYPTKIVCDPRSFLYLSGMQVDFSDQLVGGGFQFTNPNSTGSCGCGKSFTT